MQSVPEYPDACMYSDGLVEWTGYGGIGAVVAFVEDIAIADQVAGHIAGVVVVLVAETAA